MTSAAPPRRPRIVVAGGGVSGLTAAHRLLEREPNAEVTVLEASDRVGGKLRSVEVGALTLPAGADSFLARKPWATELCEELGLGSELVAPGASGSWLWTDRGLVLALKDAPFGIPGDVGDVLRWPGLSRGGKWRALQDLVRRKRKVGKGASDDDEALGSLLRRRLGDEATDLAVGPLLAGLMAGDVDRISVQAAFPDLPRWEASQGSLIRGSQAARRRMRQVPPGSAAVGPMFLRPRGGAERLTEALAERVRTAGGQIRTGAPVGRVTAAPEASSTSSGTSVPGGYLVETDAGEQLEADAVILATPAAAAAAAVHDLAPEAAAELAALPVASTGVVLMVYPSGTQASLPEGTGFVVPAGKAPMTACTWLSSKWPSEAFGTRAVVRCYVGAADHEDILEASDGELIQACARHLAAVLALPDTPEHAAVVRWPASMPQYEVGHLGRVARIRTALPPGVVVTGQPYDGVGIPDCVRAAGEIADQMMTGLAVRAPDGDART